MKSFLLTLVLTLTFLIQTTQAQTITNEQFIKPVQLTAKHYGDSIQLRWAPTTAEYWFYGIKHGYKLLRKDMSDVTNPYVTLKDTIRPWTVSEIEDYFSRHQQHEELVVPMKTMYQEWENTGYNGNDINEIIERSQNFEQRYNMNVLAADLYPIVAEASGFKYVDRDLEEGKLYSYQIRLNRDDVLLKPAYHVVNPYQILDRPIIHEIIENEGSVSIKWNREIHDPAYTAYYIERSLDGQSYKRLNEQPFIHAYTEGFTQKKYMIYNDQISNYIRYHYRIIGIDPFGEESLPSLPMQAEAKDKTPPEVTSPVIVRSEGDDTNLVKWSHDPIDEIRQAVIYKKDDVDDSKILYESVGNNFQYEIEDNDLIDGVTQYYVVLVDTAGNVSQSFPTSEYVVDKTPPLPPVNLRAEVDTTGTITLTWDQGPDRDIIGYYLYTADLETDNFIKLNQQKHIYTQYIDTVSTKLLTEKRYYKIAAIDKGGNIGKYSDILEVTRPDKIPPSPCLFYDYRVDSAGVFLGLMPSSSIDVVAHKLFRKKADAADWELIATFSKDVPEIYLDDKVASAEYYTYKWIAEDETGLQSSAEHSRLNLQALDTRIFFRPLIKLTSVDNGVKIDIGNNIPGVDYRIQLIRKLKDGKYRTLNTIEDGSLSYTDLASTENLKNIAYKARILYKDGTRSKFSKEEQL